MQQQLDKIKELENAYCSLFDTDLGKVVLEDLETVFDVNIFDESHAVMANKEGKRQVIQYIRKRLNRIASKRIQKIGELNG